MLTTAQKANFETLQNADRAGHLALLECTDSTTGELVPVVCAVNFDGEQYEFVPLARMFTGNPYDEVTPPNPDEAAEVDHG